MQHEIFEGHQASVFGSSEYAYVQVNCRKDAGGSSMPVRYGLAVSIEVAPGVDIPIYQEVKNRITPAIRIGANSP